MKVLRHCSYFSRFQRRDSNVEFSWGHRIVAARTPWLAAADSLDGEPASRHRAMGADRFNGIRGTTRFETAPGQWAEHKSHNRRDQPLIESQAESQNVLCRIQSSLNR